MYGVEYNTIFIKLNISGNFIHVDTFPLRLFTDFHNLHTLIIDEDLFDRKMEDAPNNSTIMWKFMDTCKERKQKFKESIKKHPDNTKKE